VANIFKAKTLLGRTGIFSHEVTAPNLVYNTGDQTISGIKTFALRPTVNGTGVLLSGEAAQVDLTSTVRTTGNQNISGNKTFINNLEIQGTGIFNALDLNNIDNLALSGVDITITNGNVILTNPISAPNLVYNTGNQIISGVKTFANNINVFGTGIFKNVILNTDPVATENNAIAYAIALG
jgi:hypothetical protein